MRVVYGDWNGNIEATDHFERWNRRIIEGCLQKLFSASTRPITPKLGLIAKRVQPGTAMVAAAQSSGKTNALVD